MTASGPDERLAPDEPAAPIPPGTPSTPGAPSRRGAFASLQPLRHRNFALLWSGGLVSVIGSWMQTVAVGALVVAHTGQALWAVLVAAGAFLPTGILSPVGGALADRFPRKPWLVLGNLAAAAVALGIAALVATRQDSPSVLTLLVTVQGSVSALTSPFQQAILPDLVPRREFLAASSLGSAQFNLGRVIGPALAGATIAVFGYPVAFLANAISFLAVVLALVFIRLSPPPGPREGETLLSSLGRGWRAARGTPACTAAIGTIAVVALLASPFIALVPAMADHVAHGSARRLASATGVLTTAQGVGAVLGALLLAPLALRFGRGRVLVASLCLLPLVLVVYATSSTLAFATVALFAVGLVYIGVLSGLSTLVQLSAPQEFRGRILSIYLVALGVAYPIGSLAQGPLADRIGLGWTTAASALSLALILAAVRLVRPSWLAPLVADPGQARQTALAAGRPYP